MPPSDELFAQADDALVLTPFGLVHVDYDTQRRVPKRSGLWYRDHIAESRGRRGHARRAEGAGDLKCAYF